jgi:adenylate cyclase
MSEPAPEQTFVLADLAGFTALTEAHGDAQAAELAGRFFDCVRELLAEHQAEEVKTIGDAVLLRCTDPSQAVHLATRIVDAVTAQPGFPIVRVGVHTGSAVERDGDWFGAAVNLAARVSGAASGDEILITEATRRALAESDLEGLRVHERGRYEFKNVSQPIVLYEVMKTETQSGERVVDPVCRMALPPDQCAGWLHYEGAEYHFCSLRCAATFANDPQHYAVV